MSLRFREGRLASFIAFGVPPQADDLLPHGEKSYSAV